MSSIRLSITSLTIVLITYALFRVPNVLAQLVSVVIWSVSVAFLVQQQDKNNSSRQDGGSSKLQFTPLDQDEIRLLILEPSSKLEDRLRGTLVTRHLDTGPEYTALLYHEDDNSTRDSITIDGQEVRISPSIATALRCMRSHFKLSLWLDRFCLDRSNGKEMSHQILRMSTIFQKASEAAIWLGQSDAATDIVLEKLNQPVNPELGVGLSVTELRRVIDRPIWKQLWLVQQVSASLTPRIYCGSRTLEWIGFARLIRNVAQVSTVKSSGIEAIQNIVSFHSDRLDSKKPTLLGAMCRTIHCVTDEPCDRVFALLGMVLDAMQYIDDMDFWLVRDQRRLCQRMTERHFTQMSSLDMIFLGCKGKSADLPSWCPNFMDLSADAITRSLSRYVAGLDVRFRMGCRVTKWSATGNTESGQNLFSVRNTTLKVTGAFIASVDIITGNMCDHLHEQEVYYGSNSLTSTMFRKFWADPKTRTALYELSTMYSDSAIPDGENQFTRIYERTTTMLSVARFWESVDSFQIGPQTANDGNPMTNTVMNTVKALLAEGLTLMSTSQGMPGWIHSAAETGDEIWLIKGCSMPVVLQRVIGDDRDTYRVVGHCYLSKYIMIGDLWKEVVAKGIQRSVNLV